MKMINFSENSWQLYKVVIIQLYCGAVTFMSTRHAAKSARQLIEARVEVHKRDRAPYNDRTARIIIYTKIIIILFVLGYNYTIKIAA